MVGQGLSEPIRLWTSHKTILTTSSLKWQWWKKQEAWEFDNLLPSSPPKKK